MNKFIYTICWIFLAIFISNPIMANEISAKEITENDFHKPGKGQAVMRVKYKSLVNGRVLDKTFKTGESIEKADISPNVPVF